MTTKRRAIALWDAGNVRVSTNRQVKRDALQNQVQALRAYDAAQAVKLLVY